MLKKIFKSLAWGLLTTDIHHRAKMYHHIQGHAPELALVKAWKKESYAAFMVDPNWWENRVAKKELIVFLSVVVCMTSILIYLANWR